VVESYSETSDFVYFCLLTVCIAVMTLCVYFVAAPGFPKAVAQGNLWVMTAYYWLGHYLLVGGSWLFQGGKQVWTALSGFLSHTVDTHFPGYGVTTARLVLLWGFLFSGVIAMKTAYSVYEKLAEKGRVFWVVAISSGTLFLGPAAVWAAFIWALAIGRIGIAGYHWAHHLLMTLN
jgi:hypothetical protein